MKKESGEKSQDKGVFSMLLCYNSVKERSSLLLLKQQEALSSI